MKIATYNVRNLFDPGTFLDERAVDAVQESFFNERIAYLTKYFKELDIDIICLQEIGGELGVSRVSEELGYDYFFAKPNSRGIRMAVMYKKEHASKITCESISFGELSIPSIEKHGDTSALKPIKQRRDILEIILELDGKKISINTFHLKSNLPQYLDGDDVENDTNAFIDAKFRCVFFKTMELSAIRRHVTSRLQSGMEVMLLGDFNENNTASTMDILKASQKDELRLSDVLTGYTGDPTTHIHRGNKLTFDTVLVSDGLKGKISDIKVENETLRDYSILGPGEVEHEIESDHALVWVTI